MKLRIVFILLVIFVIGCVREQNDNSIQSGITKGDDDLSKIVRDENAISQLANEDAALRNLFQKKNWDESILDETSVLKLSSVTRQCFYYDLIDPAFIYSNHEETDQALFYDQGFIAIGACGNGDFSLVFAARNS